MSYKIIENEEGLYDVYDLTSDVTIVLNRSKDKAKYVARKLNLGNGFNGFTPEFFGSFKGIDLT